MASGTADLLVLIIVCLVSFVYDLGEDRVDVVLFLVVWCRCLFSVYDKIYTHLGHALL